MPRAQHATQRRHTGQQSCCFLGDALEGQNPKHAQLPACNSSTHAHTADGCCRRYRCRRQKAWCSDPEPREGKCRWKQTQQEPVWLLLQSQHHPAGGPPERRPSPPKWCSTVQQPRLNPQQCCGQCCSRVLQRWQHTLPPRRTPAALYGVLYRQPANSLVA